MKLSFWDPVFFRQRVSTRQWSVPRPRERRCLCY